MKITRRYRDPEMDGLKSGDPLDYEDFDPSQLPPDAWFSHDEPLDVATIMQLFSLGRVS